MKLRYLALLLLFNFCSQTKEETPSFIEDLVSPAIGNSSLPYLIKGNDDNLYLSWIEQGDSNKASLKYAMLNGESWSQPELIAQGDDWFVNWADYPMMAIDKGGNKIAHFLAKSSSGTYSYDINVVTKKADSADWSLPLPPHTDNTPTEHGFVTMLPNDDGSFTLAWLDGRNTGGGHHGDHGNGAMTLRTAVLNLNGELSEESELDERICDCCQTSGAMTIDGPMFAYRDRSVDEVRDMAYVTKTDGKWTIPKLVAKDNWSIEGCPVNGPSMAALEGTTAIAWYTAAYSQPKVKVAFKSGNDFSEPIIIDETSPVGRVDLVLINDQTAIVSWLDGGRQPAIKYREVNANGSMSPIYVVTETSEERGSGFPQMEVYRNTLYFAWTQMGDKNQVMLKKVTLD